MYLSTSPPNHLPPTPNHHLQLPPPPPFFSLYPPFPMPFFRGFLIILPLIDLVPLFASTFPSLLFSPHFLPFLSPPSAFASPLSPSPLLVFSPFLPHILSLFSSFLLTLSFRSSSFSPFSYPLPFLLSPSPLSPLSFPSFPRHSPSLLPLPLPTLLSPFTYYPFSGYIT